MSFDGDGNVAPDGPLAALLESNLPPVVNSSCVGPFSGLKKRPYVTLTYAQSLDSMIAAQRGTRTAISGLETKAMTHYLRSRHDGILVGVTTALVDNPSLRNKHGDHKIRPIIVDPQFKLQQVYERSQLHANVCSGIGLAPIVVVSKEVYEDQSRDVPHFGSALGITILPLEAVAGRFEWTILFEALSGYVESVMVEGGADVINALLLRPDLVDSLIVTLGAVYLGAKGTPVSPAQGLKLKHVKWMGAGQDMILMGKLGGL